MMAEDPSKSDMAIKLETKNPFTRYSRMRLVLIVFFIMVIIATGLIFWKGHGHSKGSQYLTESIHRGDLLLIVSATGTLQPTNEVDVSSELSGIVKGVQVDYNDRVKVGQVLAMLDTTKLEAQLTQSKAALESAKAKLQQAQATVAETDSKLRQFQRVRELSQRKVPSQSEMDSAEAAFQRAKADVAAARAAVGQAEATVEANQTDLGKAVIRSPINGIVIARSIEPGQTVAASLSAPVLFTLAEDLAKMELQVDVDEADVGKVRVGQKALFTVDAYPNRSFQADITQVRYGSKTVEGVVTYKTVMKVINPDLLLRPGMTATADITVKHVLNAVLIPATALRFLPVIKEDQQPSRGLIGSLIPGPPPSPKSEAAEVKNNNNKKQNVWVVIDGQITPVAVKVGETDGKMTEITAGAVTPGMQVAVDTVGGNK